MLVRVTVSLAVILTTITGRVKSGEKSGQDVFDIDEDDEDHFGTANEVTFLKDDFYRKRRSQEEGFYHTLLSRTEPQHVFKRSHGTEDFEHSNAMFITDRDWTGSSKISDADKKELESLFSKLNADDSEEKNDVTRSLPDDELLSPIDNAAYKYAAWLMGQNSKKALAGALTQKAQVDHRLTNMFFDKRGLENLLPNEEPLTNEKRYHIKKPSHQIRKGAAAVQNLTLTAKHLIMSGPKLCTDDSAKCLCTRACYPSIVASIKPCQCEGKSGSEASLSQRSPIPGKKVDDKPSATIRAKVSSFPPQAPAAAPAAAPQSFSPQKDLLNANKGGVKLTSPSLLNTSGPSDEVKPVEAASLLKPQVSVGVIGTNASVKSEVSKIASASSPAIMTNSTSKEEPAESKSIEPIHGNKLRQAVVPVQVAATVVNASQGLFGSNLPIYLDHPSYQGCYKDRKPIRDLPKRFTRFDTTPESCIMECKYQNYKFAGVQYGYLCFCGNGFGRYGKVTDKDCNSFCNGDPKRKCGAFWHNSVYSTDGKHYDPGIFDYAKIDEEERVHDSLLPPPVKVQKKSQTKLDHHINVIGADAATHLMDAAQATLKAAKKLLPGVSKKHKIGKDGKRGKREDDEDDAELMYERDMAMKSLKAAHQLLQKTNWDRMKRNAEKEKRSISEDFDPYDPDDGKDLLQAYMSSVEAYKRQTRSVDDEEEEDNDKDKQNFIYRRMSEAELQEGTFVDKYEDPIEVKDERELLTAKRSAEKDQSSPSKADESKDTSKVKEDRKRSASDVSENDAYVVSKKDNSALPTAKKHVNDTNQLEKRDVEENKSVDSIESTASTIKKRSLPEKEHTNVQAENILNQPEPDNTEKFPNKKKRDLSDSKRVTNKKRRIPNKVTFKGGEKEEPGNKKKRSLNEAASKSHELPTLYTLSEMGKRKKRLINNPEDEQVKSSSNAKKAKPYAVFETEDDDSWKTKRDLSAAEEHIVKKKNENNVKSGKTVTNKQHIEPPVEEPFDAHWDRRKRSISEEPIAKPLISKHSRKRREIMSMDLSNGALKMAARSSDVNDIAKSLQRLEEIEKRKRVIASEEEDKEAESGAGSDAIDEDPSGDDSNEITNEEKDKDVRKRSSESEKVLPAKRSKPEKADKDVDDVKLKRDVEKGVDSLLNLVVELYKQQKTIKNFENSVRTLRHDILKELNIPSKDKNAATKKVRNAIQSAAKERLHTLTSSIEHKITEFAKRHPESVKQAKLATSLLPKIPLNEKSLKESKREITRRAAEFDDIENGFDEFAKQSVPDILKEHFKRNAETDDVEIDVPMQPDQDEKDLKPSKRNSEDDDVEGLWEKKSTHEETRKSKRSLEHKKRVAEVRPLEVNGERTLSRMHRDVSEEEQGLDDDDDEMDENYDKLFK